jgi:hypothetical protein
LRVTFPKGREKPPSQGTSKLPIAGKPQNKGKKEKTEKMFGYISKKKGKAKPGLLIKRGSRPVLYLHKLETMITK